MGATQSSHHRSRSAFSRGNQRPSILDPGCLGCFPNPDKLESHIDNAELQTHNKELVPKGKVSKTSIAYLSKDEVGFLKACAGKNVSALRFYMNKGINVNLLDEDRTSPLHVASRSGSLQVIEELINWGAAVNIADMAGWTPLHIAAHYQRPFVCHLLLKKGADPYLTSRNGETPWDFVKEKNTEEVFYVHFDRAELKKMGKFRTDEPPGEVIDENILINKLEVRDKSFLNKLGVGLRMGGGAPVEDEKIDDRSYILSIRGTEGMQNDSIVGVNRNNVNTVGNKYYINTKRNPTNQNHFIQNKRKSENKYRMFCKSEYLEKSENDLFRSKKLNDKTSQRGNSKEDNPLEASQVPKKHKYYSHFRKLKALNLTDFKQNKDVLCTLESEESGFHDNSHLSFHDASLIADQSFQRPGITYTKNTEIAHEDLSFQKLKSASVAENFFPLGKPPILNSSKSKDLVPPLKSPLLGKKINLPPYRYSKQFNGHQQYFETQQQQQQNAHLRHSRESSIQGNHTRRSSAVSCVEKTTLSGVSIMQTSPSLSIYKLISKDRDIVGLANKNNNTGNVVTEVDNLVDLNLFKVESKFTKALYNMGIQIFNHDSLQGLAFMFLFRLLRQTPRDVAAFLHKNDSLETVKKNPSQVTQLLSNTHLKESLDILYHYAGFFQFEGMTFLEALRTYLAGFVIENDPERIDWLLRGFTKRYYSTVKRLEQPIRANRGGEPRSKETFETPEAVYMLSFATVMLDIELNHTAEGESSIEGHRQEGVIRGEFYVSLAYVNGGENFSKALVDDIFDEVKKRKVIRAMDLEGAGKKEKNGRITFGNNRLAISVKKVSKKNKKTVKEYIFTFEGPVCIVTKVDGDKIELNGMFMTKGCKAERTRDKKIRVKRINSEEIPYAKYRSSGDLVVSSRQEIEVVIENADDVLKLQRYLEPFRS